MSYRTLYEPLQQVADGPIAEVWRARSASGLGYSRPFCLRVLKRELAGHRRFMSTFLDQHAAIAERLPPHVEVVLDAFEDDGDAVLVSEWIEGVRLDTLASFLEPFPWPLALALALELLDALALLRRRGLVHGAVAGRTVRVGVDGRSRLTHVGLVPALVAAGWDEARMEAAGFIVDEAPSPEEDVQAVADIVADLLAPGDRALGEARPDVPPLALAALERFEDHPDPVHLERTFRILLRTVEEPVDADAIGQAVRDAMAEAMSVAASAVPPARTMRVDMQDLQEVLDSESPPPMGEGPSPPPRTVPPPLPTGWPGDEDVPERAPEEDDGSADAPEGPVAPPPLPARVSPPPLRPSKRAAPPIRRSLRPSRESLSEGSADALRKILAGRGVPSERTEGLDLEALRRLIIDGSLPAGQPDGPDTGLLDARALREEARALGLGDEEE
jgi:hypothetical protein